MRRLLSEAQRFWPAGIAAKKVLGSNDHRLPIAIPENAVSFSSACTTKRFPLSRCVSGMKIVRPSESKT